MTQVLPQRTTYSQSQGAREIFNNRDCGILCNALNWERLVFLKHTPTTINPHV